MSIEAGTPRFGQKVAVALGLGHAIGLTDAQIATVQAGDKADFTKGEQVMLQLLTPVMNVAEADVQGDMTAFLVGMSKAIPVGSVTSLGQIAAAIKAAAQALGGTIHTQIAALESSTFNTLVSAAASAAGHTNLTAG